MAKPMNAMISLGVSGVFQVLRRLFLDAAGALPLAEISTPTNLNCWGNHWVFVSFQVRLYFLATMHMHRTAMNAFSLETEKRNVSSIMIVDPLLSEGVPPCSRHISVHNLRRSCIIARKRVGALRMPNGMTRYMYFRPSGA